MAAIDSLLVHMKENDGSDLHLVAGQPPRFRAKGRIQIIPGHDVLSNETLRAMMQEIATTRAWDEYESRPRLRCKMKGCKCKCFNYVPIRGSQTSVVANLQA